METKFKPFIPDYIPAVGDIDAFIKVQSNNQIVFFSITAFKADQYYFVDFVRKGLTPPLSPLFTDKIVAEKQVVDFGEYPLIGSEKLHQKGIKKILVIR